MTRELAFRESAREVAAASNGVWTWDALNGILLSQRAVGVDELTAAEDLEGFNSRVGDDHDVACLPAVAQQQQHIVEIHILFSPTWELPTLFLAGHHAASGEPLALDAISRALCSVGAPRYLSITLQVSIHQVLL